jgi:RNA polymerase sigma factor (sigma-70 family)
MPSRMARGLSGFPMLPQASEDECTAEPGIVTSAIGNSVVRYVRLRLKTDEELVADLLANQPDALTVLFERHSALVFRIARRTLRNDAEAEDALQHVFIDMFRAAEQFDPAKGSFKSWLLMFAYHRTFNSHRHLCTHGFYDSDSLEELPQELIQGTSRPLSFAPAEAVILVEQVLKLIQPRQRQKDKQTLARRVYGMTPQSERSGKKKHLAAILSVSERAVADWLADVDRDAKAARNVRISAAWLASCYLVYVLLNWFLELVTVNVPSASATTLM